MTVDLTGEGAIRVYLDGIFMAQASREREGMVLDRGSTWFIGGSFVL